MIKGRGIMHLDGSYKRQFPEPTEWSSRDGPKWVVTKAGPRYFNVYEVLEFDEAGLRWLEEHEQKDESEPARFAAISRATDQQLGWDFEDPK